jgi:pyruvate kinase
VESVQMMAKIALEAEARLPYERMLLERSTWLGRETDELISYDACHTAHRLGAVAIVAFTESGSTARRVSKYRPGVSIVAMTPYGTVCQRLLLYWGVHPVRIPTVTSVEGLFATAARICKEARLGKSGDLIVITAGLPIGTIGSTNLLKVERIE